jgi:hypothetical protein
MLWVHRPDRTGPHGGPGSPPHYLGRSTCRRLGSHALWTTSGPQRGAGMRRADFHDLLPSADDIDWRAECPAPMSCDRAHIPLRIVHGRSASRHSLTDVLNAAAAAVFRAFEGDVPPSSSPQRAERTRSGSYSTLAPSFTKGMIRFPRRSFRKKCTDKLSKFAASNSSTSSFRPSTTRTPVRQPRVAFRLDHLGVGPTEPFRRLSAFLSRIVGTSLSTAEW